MNPKALSLGELYGEYDLNTNEWTDGILSSVMRTACAGTASRGGNPSSLGAESGVSLGKKMPGRSVLACPRSGALRGGGLGRRF